MSGSLLVPAFEHHLWATVRVIDACLDLSTQQLQTNAPGTRGPIIQTLRHIVDADAFDLFTLTGDPAFRVDAEGMSLPELRATAERIGAGWARFLSEPFDLDEMVREVDETDGYERSAPISFRVAGALEHGADHRSQICTALTILSIEPPAVDVMSYGLDVGTVIEKLPGG